MLSLPKSRKTIRHQEAKAQELREALKSQGIRRKAQREKLVQKAASGRPSDIRQQALKSLAARRVQKAIDTIAGRSA